MPGRAPGSIWVESSAPGTDLHWLDQDDVEWKFTGTFVAAAPSNASLGSWWIEGDDLHYLDFNGDERIVFGPDELAQPGQSGSAWAEPDHTDHTDAPTHGDHGDHTDGHADGVVGRAAWLDSNKHKRRAHQDIHTDTHDDVAFFDDHHDTHTDHTDSTHDDSHADHTDHADHVDTHTDHADHVDHTDHQDVAHVDTFFDDHHDTHTDHTDNIHDDTHGDHTDHADHVDTHTDHADHDDAHTDTHTDHTDHDDAHTDPNDHLEHTDHQDFHTDGHFETRISGEVRLLAIRGMEYEPVELKLDASPASDRSETVRLKRWSQMAKEDWRSGDVHVHLHYGGEYLLGPEDASLVQRAEDVHFMNMMVANQGSAFVHDKEYFEGTPHELSDPDHILRWGEEYRNDFYGHLCMYGIRELVPPIFSGFRLSEHPHDVPANSVAADRCHTVGGTLSYAHPLFGNTELDRIFARARTVEAKELPVDVALRKIDALDVMSYPSVDLETARLWYRLLNCGFRLPATAGTDTFMNLVDFTHHSNPPAGNRTFVQVEGGFSTESWCDGVRSGKTFVTNGPMLKLTVDGHGIGDEIEWRAGNEIVIEGEAQSFAPIERLELVVNGKVEASGEVAKNGRRSSLSHHLRVDASCWVALRALGPASSLVLGGDLFAHTSPVYVSVAGVKVERNEDAAYFVEWIDRLVAMCREHGRYDSEAEREQVVELFRSAKARFDRIAEAIPESP